MYTLNFLAELSNETYFSPSPGQSVHRRPGEKKRPEEKENQPRRHHVEDQRATMTREGAEGSTFRVGQWKDTVRVGHVHDTAFHRLLT